MNHPTNVQLGVLSVVLLITGILLMYMIIEIRERGKKSREAESEARKAEYAKREQRQKRDHQMNHAAQIRNWLAEEFMAYRDFGIRVRYFTQNDGSSSIHIEDVGAGLPSIPLLQITFDFVKYEAPYLGHIHYGANGTDIRFWVGDQAPKVGLERLVTKEVRRYVESQPLRLVNS